MAEQSVQTFRPSAELEPFVEQYRYRVATLAGDGCAPLIFPTRTAQFLEFYLGDPIRVRQDGVIETVPKVVLVGTQAVRRLELFVGKQSRTFTIMFRPTGFLRLFGIPLTELAGCGIPAEDALGVPVLTLYERLGNSTNAQEMIATANAFLREYAEAAKLSLQHQYQPIESTLASISKGPTPFSIDRLAYGAMVGQRQFERLFKQATGVSAKRYLRVMRLNEALDVKRQHPSLPWSTIAMNLGYFDQMHLVHDFRSLGGEAPNALLLSTSSPER